MKTPSPEQQLAAFLAEYTPDIAALTRAAVAKMRRRIRGADLLVYNNYNALVVGFGPAERPSDAILSIAAYPRWVNLFFLAGAELDDPENLLKGTGKIVRSIRIDNASDLDRPAIRALVTQAIARADGVTGRAKRGRLIIRAASIKRRRRRPGQR
jgi:hypothetical protein